MAGALSRFIAAQRVADGAAPKRSRRRRRRRKEADVEEELDVIEDTPQAYHVLVEQLASGHSKHEPTHKKQKILKEHDAVTKAATLPAHSSSEHSEGMGTQPDVAAQQQHGDEENGTAPHEDSNGKLHSTNAEDGEKQEDADLDDATEGQGDVAEDRWAVHFGRELSSGEVSELQGAVPEYADLEQGPHKGVWGEASWQGWRCTELPEPRASLEGAGVKERLKVRWREVLQEGAAGTSTSGREAAGDAAASSEARTRADLPDPQQRSLFAAVSTYRDVAVPCHPYPTTSLSQPDPLIDVVLLHALNHVAKTADRIKRNNDRIKAREAAAADAAKAGADPPAAELPPRDQGFTRAKVLLLMPQRNLAFHRVCRLVSLVLRESRADSVINKDKFVEQYFEEDEELTEEMAARRAKRPPEFRALFDGCMDDNFLLGIKLARGQVRLMADYYDSDILVGSPLGVVTRLQQEGGVEEGAADFLSSIEVLVVERADMLGMQNWMHLQSVLEATNQLPKQQRGVDIMRVKEYFLSGLAKHYRQTVLLSSFLTPDINSLLSRSCHNYAGRLRLKPSSQGVLSLVVHQVQQLYERVPAPTPADAASARFQRFTAAIWPRIKDASSHGLLLFIPSYFDFVRLRNFLQAEEASFTSVCEYTSTSARSRARAHFFHGRRRIMLYTERAHFYNRLQLRGVKDVVFYELPQHPNYYTEVVNMMEEAGGQTSTHGTVTVLFCKYDALELERVVGTSRCRKMLKSDKSTFIFC